ncbi:hypothetical protein M9458_036744, partial [Cirrhinus mrigala]
DDIQTVGYWIDGHDYCLTCLGLGHAEVALMDGSCFKCGSMTISVLRSGAPAYIPRSRSSSGPAQKKPTLVNNPGDLRAYTACGEAASALHAIALLQVHQAKALKELHECSSNKGVMQELRAATDLALRATKVIARSLGRAMSTLVVQERHLWLNLADMREPNKVRFLSTPVCQASLSGDAVENFAQQFSVAQKQTEAIKHILPQPSAAASTGFTADGMHRVPITPYCCQTFGPWSDPSFLRCPGMLWCSWMPRPRAGGPCTMGKQFRVCGRDLNSDFFGAAQIDLFASPDSTHCQLFYSLTECTLSTDALAHGWPQGLRKYAFPPVSLLAQTLCKVREDGEQVLLVAILAQPDLVFGTYAPHDSPSLAHSSEEGSAFSETGHSLAPASRPLETSYLVPGWDTEVLSGLPQGVVDTIISTRAPSTRRLYALKWN